MQSIPLPISFIPSNIFDYMGVPVQVPEGQLLCKLYSDGWTVQFIPSGNISGSKLEGVDVWTACRFLNDRSN
jgi:hypothetical protein